MHFLVQKHFCLAHKSRVFCDNTLMGAIIQETGGPLREERAVDGKLKSRLEWPYGHTLWISGLYYDHSSVMGRGVVSVCLCVQNHDGRLSECISS